MIIDYRNHPNGMPHKIFDVDGIEQIRINRPAQVVNTETGECECLVRCDHCNSFVETAAYGEILREKVVLKAPLRVVDCDGNEVTDIAKGIKF